MKRLLFILTLLIATCAIAQPIPWFSASTVKTALNVTSTIDLTPRGPNPYVETLSADVLFIPKNSAFSAIRSLHTNPDALVTTDRAKFAWTTPDIGTLPYSYDAIVETANNAPRVRAKIPYPAQFTKELEPYTLPTRHIDSDNAAILGQATLLARNQDDLFVLVTTLASWTKNNVAYNLSTLTADVSQNASWVLQNKVGVCDEITTLYIAMLRSLGIPAKFVSGIAYTDTLPGYGAHGWAEVYFPGTGWVPFDPTFGEYGWVDPSHIKLKESLDPREPTTLFEWKARDTNVTVHDLAISARLLETKEKTPFELSLKATPFRPRVGLGSSNGIALEAQNLADYYVATELTLARVSDLALLSNQTQTLTLAPHQTKKAIWKVKVRDGLSPKYQYEMPIHIYNIRNDSADTSFFVGQWDIIFSQIDVDNTISLLLPTTEDPFDLACTTLEDTVTTNTASATCTLHNEQKTNLAVTVCSPTCQNLNLPPDATTTLPFTVNTQTPGKHDLLLTATAGSFQKTAGLTLNRLDTPHIDITNIQVPSDVNYRDTFTVTFTLSRASFAPPQNLTITLTAPGTRAKATLGELPIDQEVRLNIPSNQLRSANPTITILATYQDNTGKQLQSTAETTLHITGMPWYKRLLGWLTNW